MQGLVRRRVSFLERTRGVLFLGALAGLSWCGANGCAVDGREVQLPEVAILSERGAPDAGAAPGVIVASSGAGLGLVCSDAGECASGFCVDGVCCDTGCADVCASCSEPGTEGTCSPIPSDPLCSALACPEGTECRGLDTSQASSNCEGIGVCRTTATCQATNFLAGTSCQNGTGACDGNGACAVPGKLLLAAACTTDAECAEGNCASDGSASICCGTPCNGECQQCSASGHCEAVPTSDPRCPVVPCPPDNVCRDYGGDLAGACHGFASCASVTDCTYTPLRDSADCNCDAQGNCSLLRGAECQSDAECTSGACIPTLGAGKSVCCATACGTGLSCAEDGSGCVECSADQVSCEGLTELRCQANGLFARSACPLGCTEGQGCNALPGVGFTCDLATGCLGGLPCQQDSTGAQRCCARDCSAEGRICAENGSCACPPDQIVNGAACLLRAGDPCTGAADCESGQCVDGVCCLEGCDGACEQCQAGTGVCTPVSAGQQDGLCAAGTQCTGARGDCRANLRERCTANDDCASSNCEPAVAGGQVCCAVSCDGTTSCSSDGQRCVECEANAASACGNGCNAQTSTCNPLRPIGSPCGVPQQCAAPGQCLIDNTNVSRCCEANCSAQGRVCNTSGACVCPPNQIEINGQCLSAQGQACSDNASCASNACSLVVGGGRRCCARPCNANELCAPDGSACIDQRGAVGAGCTSNAECQNDNCVNNVCCAGSCGACQRCQQATGLCQADTSASCTLASGMPGSCTQGQCVDPGAGPGQLCGVRACQAGLVCTTAGVCCNSQCNGPCESACSNGQGTCNTPATDARCGQTQCSAGQCQASQPLQTNRSCIGPGACASPAADRCSAPTGTSGGTCALMGGGTGQCNNGACSPLLAGNGAACGTGSQCQSGICTGGFCCAGPCAGPCSTCQQGTGACVPVAPQTPCGPGGSHQLCINGSCTLPSVLCNGVNQQLTATSACCGIAGEPGGVRETFSTRASCPPSSLDAGGVTTTPVTCDNATDCPNGEICCFRSVGESAIECTSVAECTTLPTTHYVICSSPAGVVASCQRGACSPFFLGGFVTGWGFCQ